jgi:fatty acid-binding protein DegV
MAFAEDLFEQAYHSRSPRENQTKTSQPAPGDIDGLLRAFPPVDQGSYR